MSDNYNRKKILEGSGKLTWFHWVVILLSLFLTFTAWYISKTYYEEKIKRRFDIQSKQVIALIKERMQKYEDALWSGVAAIRSQTHGIDYLEWKDFADTLNLEDKYPGINGIGVIYYVSQEMRESFLQEERKLRPNFSIHPEENREEYWPITYIEPVESNKQAVGLDMAFESNRYNAIKKARDKGKPQITAPIILVQDAEKTPGFLFYVPFYEKNTAVETLVQRKNNVKGVVYAPFIMKKLMAGTLENKNRMVNLSIHDEEEMIYDEHNEGEEDYDASPMFTKKVLLEMYGRPWEIYIRAAKSFKEIAYSSQPLMILIGGLFIDSLLLLLFTTLSRTNQRALVLANELNRELKASEKFQNLIKESNPDFICVRDDKFRIVDFNKAFITMCPQDKRDEIIGSTLFDNYSNEQKENFLETAKLALENGYSISQETVTFPNGENKILHTQKISFEVADGKTFILVISRDETEKEKLVKQLFDSNIELERFAYIASHDMQEPVRMVQNFSKLLSQEYSDKLNESGKQYLNIISDSSTRMKSLIDDLLEYSRMGHQNMELCGFNAEEVMHGIIENLHGLIAEKNAQIKVENLSYIYGNPVQISRLIQNLITNAIKYQPKNKVPEIKITMEEQEKHLHVSVEDNGIGIKAEFLDNIFQPFKRLHSWNNIQGTGLGLSICRKIVENHGGKMWVESKEGKGSVFYFTIKKQQNNDGDVA